MTLDYMVAVIQDFSMDCSTLDLVQLHNAYCVYSSNEAKIIHSMEELDTMTDFDYFSGYTPTYVIAYMQRAFAHFDVYDDCFVLDEAGNFHSGSFEAMIMNHFSFEGVARMLLDLATPKQLASLENNPAPTLEDLLSIIEK